MGDSNKKFIIEKVDTAMLFPNNKTKDTQPDYTGQANIAGDQFRVSTWKNKAKNGNGEYLSLKFTSEIDEETKDIPEEIIGNSVTPKSDAPTDDDIPF